LKKVTLGGSVRGQSAKTIGYYGLQSLPDIITEFDNDRPITVPAETKIDLFLSYRTRIANDKIGLTLQLNARNITENGHLEPIVAWPDGTMRTFHIIDPRQYIISAKFDF